MHNKKYVEIANDITSDTSLSSCFTYVVKKAIKIRTGVTLKIQDNTEILFVNKTASENVTIVPKNENSTNPNDISENLFVVTGSSLIFEAGSKLHAENLYINSCNEKYIITSISQNCGLFFLGTYTSSQYNILNVFSNIETYKSSFKIKNLHLNYIGSLSFLCTNEEDGTSSLFITENPSSGNVKLAIPFNSVTVCGCGNDELLIENIHCNSAGSNGLWTQYSNFHMDSLKVIGYQGNALLSRGSKIDFSHKLFLIQNLAPTFPQYGGVLVNIADIVGNKPLIIPFPPDEYNLPKNLVLSTIKLRKSIKLYLYEPVTLFRQTVDVIEAEPKTIFSDGPIGTYYKNHIDKLIILTRRVEPLSNDVNLEFQ